MSDRTRQSPDGPTGRPRIGLFVTRLVDEKCAHVLATGAGVLLGGDLGCLMNIAGRLARESHPVRVFHVAEVLAGMAGRALGERRLREREFDERLTPPRTRLGLRMWAFAARRDRTAISSAERHPETSAAGVIIGPCASSTRQGRCVRTTTTPFRLWTGWTWKRCWG